MQTQPVRIRPAVILTSQIPRERRKEDTLHRIQIERIHDVLCAKVGCQQFFYFTPEAVVADLAFYLKGDPGKIQDAYFSAKRAINDRKELPEPVSEMATTQPDAPQDIASPGQPNEPAPA